MQTPDQLGFFDVPIVLEAFRKHKKICDVTNIGTLLSNAFYTHYREWDDYLARHPCIDCNCAPENIELSVQAVFLPEYVQMVLEGINQITHETTDFH